MERVYVVDFGSPQARAVAKEVRRSGVFSEIIPAAALGEALKKRRPEGIILVGDAAEGKLLELSPEPVPVLSLAEKTLETDQLEEFLFEHCRCSPDWNMDAFLARAVPQLQRQVGSGKAVCGLSGGVDSSVAALLVHRAIGEGLTCIFVDHGLMRARESENVAELFQQEFKLPLIMVEARDRFIDKLAGVEDPEEKRKIIGREFISVFEEEAAKIKAASFLVQGTLYPDVLESGAQAGQALIKSHHNVGGLPEDLKLELVEPLKVLFKDEVRVLGQKLNLPEEMVWRHPFPGPGLAIRIMGEVTRDKLAILRRADAIAMEEIRRAGLYGEIWQAAVVLTNMRTVGVRDNKRTYEYVAALRFVSSVDGMSADWSRVPHELLARISGRLTAEVEGINRVVYDISSKPPATIEWE